MTYQSQDSQCMECLIGIEFMNHRPSFFHIELMKICNIYIYCYIVILFESIDSNLNIHALLINFRASNNNKNSNLNHLHSVKLFTVE